MMKSGPNAMLEDRLGPPLYRESKVFRGTLVRISDDYRRTVVFLGIEDDTPGGSGIHCVGTGFFAEYETCRYLITVKHVAARLVDGPFLIRINDLAGGGSRNAYFDVGDLRWFSHPDSDVDLAIASTEIDFHGAGLDVKFLTGLGETPKGPSGFECGELCYTIGLFRLMTGNRRNLPVVHFGTIALLPSDEKVPVRDWDKPNDPGARKLVEAYLVESQSIEGLSGAPVLARPSIELRDLPTRESPTSKVVLDSALVPRIVPGILGVWQGAWDAKADEVLQASAGRELRVPVGMGVVVPAKKIVEILEMPDAKEHRKEIAKKRAAATAAGLDAAPLPKRAPANDENPRHREDFNSLVGAAARKQKQGD
jgi:hypothetical protein